MKSFFCSHTIFSRKSLIFSGFIALVLMLQGCSGFTNALGGENSVDYKSVVRTDPLSIPPDLTQVSNDPRYRAPASGSTTFSQFQQQGQETGKATPTAQSSVLPTRTDMRVQRDGDLRWLVVDMPADKVFSMTSDFWLESGFALDVTDPKAGLMVTNWAENRAKIPESFIREALGKVLDGLWDSGTRDKFSTRIERVGNNRTEIYISHRHMEEKNYSTQGQTDVRWMNGKEDPGLNAAMIARLMVFLGEDVDGARKKMGQAQVSAQEPKVSVPANDKTVILIDESFERAWRRVGVALDSGGFAVDDRDRTAGDFYVRYVDTDTGAKREETNFFTRLFGAKDPTTAPTYRLHLTQKGTQTEVAVFDANGKRDTSPTAQRILAVLSGKM
jgi:outer membrane protein assembly factor BamC